MRSNKNLTYFLPLGILLLLTGCASAPMVTDADVAMTKEVPAGSGKAKIYVYRNEMMGAAISMAVALDGKVAGKSASKTYFVWKVAPGAHEIMSQGKKDEAITVNAEAGKSYFVWQEVKMSAFVAGSKLQLVDDATGKAGVKECVLTTSSL